MTNPITGGCSCGALRYEIAAEPIMAGHCQCLDCQKSTGAGHASLLMVPVAAAKIQGAPRYFASKADSGNTTERGFCTTCGSTVFGRTSGNSQGMVVFAGSLDDPSRFKPQFSVFAKRGNAWDPIDPSIPHFDGMPPRQAS